MFSVVPADISQHQQFSIVGPSGGKVACGDGLAVSGPNRLTLLWTFLQAGGRQGLSRTRGGNGHVRSKVKSVGQSAFQSEKRWPVSR